MNCPGCGHDNIQGVDHCEDCGLDLAGLDIPEAGSGFRGRLLNDRLADAGLSTAVVVDPATPVKTAIEEMRRRECGCTLIVDGGKLVGIFDERDVLMRVVVPGIDAEATTIEAVMSPEPLRLSIDDPPGWAVHCMVARDFRHLAVLAGGEVAGYISVRNILTYIEREFMQATA